MYAAKTYAAFLGAVLTALLASGLIPVEGAIQTVLTILSVVATAVATYNAKNNGQNVPAKVETTSRF